VDIAKAEFVAKAPGLLAETDRSVERQAYLRNA